MESYLRRHMTRAARRTYGRIQNATVNGNKSSVLVSYTVGERIERPALDSVSRKSRKTEGSPLTFAHNQTLKYLSNDDLKFYFSGATVMSETENGFPIKVITKSDGTLAGEIEGSSSVYYDDGKWWVKDPNLICEQFRIWREGRVICSKYVKEGDSFIRYHEDGSVAVLQPKSISR